MVGRVLVEARTGAMLQTDCAAMAQNNSAFLPSSLHRGWETPLLLAEPLQKTAADDEARYSIDPPADVARHVRLSVLDFFQRVAALTLATL